MRRMNRIWVGVGGSVAVVAAVAGVTLGITTLFGVNVEEGEPKPVQGVQTGRYPGLSICVQALPGDTAVEAIAKAKIETAVLEVAQDPYWGFLRLNGAPPLVEIGCPSGPLVARPGLTWLNAQYASGDLEAYNVSEPSFYRHFLFIVPIDQINQMLGGLVVRVAPQEMVPSGHVSSEETTALFISPEELQDSSFLVDQLTIAVGLEDRLADLQ